MSETVDTQVLIGGVDVTRYLDLNQSQPAITAAINNELDTLELVLYNADAAVIEGWAEIKILDTTDGETHYAGYALIKAQSAGDNRAKNNFAVSASDFGAYLEKTTFTGELTDVTDAEILAAVQAGASPAISDYDFTTHVSAVRTFPRVVFKLKPVSEIIAWLADKAGANWYIDYDKCLHYFGSEAANAPFGVTDDPTDTANVLAENVQINTDATGVVNWVELVGGSELGADSTFKFTQPGYNTVLNLNRKLKPWSTGSQIVVRRNDGGPTTNLITNPSFETDITTGWTQYQAGSGAAWARTTSKYAVGAASLQITAGTAVAVMQGVTVSLPPGKTLTVQAKVWSQLIGKAAIVMWDTGNSINRGECYNRKASTWELVTAGYYNNTGTTLSIRVELYNNACDSSSICYYDAVQAELLQWPSAYCDGSLGTGYAWAGTAHASTSTRVDVPVWTTLTVKTGKNDTLGARNEVLFYESEGKLEQETFWPTIIDAIEVDGRVASPVHIACKSYASYQHYGRWFKQVINDASIVDGTVARIKCATVLAESAMETTAVTLDVRRKGLRPGMTLPVKLAARKLDDDYLIKRVSTTIGIGGHIVSTVELGAVEKQFVTLLKEQLAAANEIDSEIDSDDVLEMLLDFIDDLGKMEDSGATVTATSAPYVWDTPKWGYAVWG